MTIDLDILPTFLEEAQGYLAILRDASSTTEQRRKAAHNLKGAASMIGLDEVQQQAKGLEAELTGGEVEPAQLAGPLEAIAQLLEQLGRGDLPPEPPSPLDDDPPVIAMEEDWDPETATMLRALFVEEAQEHLEAVSAALIQLGADPSSSAPLDEMLRKAHTLKGSASTVGLARISKAAHMLEGLLVEARDGALSVNHRRLEQLLDATDLLREMAEACRGGDVALPALELFAARLTEIRAVDDGQRLPTTEQPAVQPDEDDRPPLGRKRSPTAERRSILNRRTGERRLDEAQRVRVDVSRLDALMNDVGELVIQRTSIEQRVEELKGLARDLSISRRALHGSLTDVTDHRTNGSPALTRIREVDVEVADAVANLERATSRLVEDSEDLRRTSTALQDSLTRLRMMPIRWLLARLQRPVREAASTEGKLIELVTEEESTEMDRSVIEQITDPLIHLVRNSIAHGIESPEARLAAGKSQVGLIRIRARHQGDLVYLEVEDDGAGIDPERLRQTLRTRADLPEEEIAALDDDAVFKTIFTTGFSTRTRPDELAGRGMGLDIVHRNISQLGGALSVSSEPGQGTRFTIQLPVATAIADALLFKVGEPVYAVPVAYVTETIFVEPGDLREEEGRCRLEHRGNWIPVVYLHQILGGDPPLPLQRKHDPSVSQARQPIVVLHFGDAHFGVTCTRVVGPRVIVLKGLGALLSRHTLFAAATISGSSKVQFVLEVGALAQLAVTGLHGARAAGAAPLSRQDEPRILVVDDSRSVRAAMEHILRNAGYAVDLAADGWEAWERLQLRAYDLLLTDLEMPRLHGYELIAKCRKAQALAQMPILVLTSRTSERNRLRTFERGADGFLGKPINRTIVLEQIEQLLDRAEPVLPVGVRFEDRP
jgi:chemotaxis protein histidine kinase CheA/ActR/RegA family two-component response regulator